MVSVGIRGDTECVLDCGLACEYSTVGFDSQNAGTVEPVNAEVLNERCGTILREDRRNTMVVYKWMGYGKNRDIDRNIL